MSAPAPLTADEQRRIWRWQRRMFAFYGLAMALLALAAALLFSFGELAVMRRAALLGLGVVFLAASFVQFRERCPRCGLRLGRHGRLLLPERCRGCGVGFEPPAAGSG
jgi:hypothetical protein